jgi:hypothetical protein
MKLRINEEVRAIVAPLTTFSLVKAVDCHRFYVTNRPSMDPNKFQEFQMGCRASAAYIKQMLELAAVAWPENKGPDEERLRMILISAQKQVADYNGRRRRDRA